MSGFVTSRYWGRVEDGGLAFGKSCRTRSWEEDYWIPRWIPPRRWQDPGSVSFANIKIFGSNNSFFSGGARNGWQMVPWGPYMAPMGAHIGPMGSLLWALTGSVAWRRLASLYGQPLMINPSREKSKLGILMPGML